jgi:hypothetical protein
MERQKYLKHRNYKNMHSYLTAILNKIELDVYEYLKAKLLQDFLIKKTLILAQTRPVFSYSISFEFFEESDEIGYKENVVNFIVVLTFNDKDLSFDILADISSFYETISSGWYQKINILPDKAKDYFEKLPDNFLKVLDNFFNNELDVYKDETE